MVRAKLLRSIVFAVGYVVIVLGLVGCDVVREGMQDTRTTENDLKSELGLDTRVEWRSSLAMSGRYFVTVRVKSAPSEDRSVSKRKVNAIVVRDFRSKVYGVHVQF